VLTIYSPQELKRFKIRFPMVLSNFLGFGIFHRWIKFIRLEYFKRLIMVHRRVAVYYDFQNVRDAIKSVKLYNYVLTYIEQFAERIGKIVIKDLFIKSNKYFDEDRIVSFHEKRDWSIIFGERGKDTDSELIVKALADCYENKFAAHDI